MLYKFFLAQWENPTKQDWTEQIKKDLSDIRPKYNAMLEGNSVKVFILIQKHGKNQNKGVCSWLFKS